MADPHPKLASTADGSQTLYSERYAQTFHSQKGALTESKHVFLEASGVTERLVKKQATDILEVGFGTGLNFFLSADAAFGAGSSLRYTAAEQNLLAADLISSLGYEAHLNRPELLDAYLEFRSSLPDGITDQVFEFEGVRLELLLGEATEQAFSAATYDAVYQDAFSPDANPELWTLKFLSKLHAALRAGGVLTTYCVKGSVRRSLAALGFAVQKRPGPLNGKREMLRAVKRSAAEATPVRADAPGNS